MYALGFPFTNVRTSRPSRSAETDPVSGMSLTAINRCCMLLLLSGAFIGGIWLAPSWKLPHLAEVELRDLLPGALLVAVGVEAVHLLTVLWYANKIANSSGLYGSLGAAVGLLAWLHLLGRLTIASVVLNATLWRRRTPVRPGPTTGRARRPARRPQPDVARPMIGEGLKPLTMR
jgi:uncharacterized BrkB/YihY/UPF0761 family membrane protein